MNRRVTECLLIMAACAMLAGPHPAIARTNDDANGALTPAQQARAFEEATEKIRTDCVRDRRIICGRIIKIVPDGLVVESGYTNLMQPPLNKSWLIPGTVQTTLPANLVEGNQPGCVCIGLVFLTGLPKSRLAQPKPYDYVVIQGYPMGRHTYTSVGTVQRTVRCFAATLSAAIQANRRSAGITAPNQTREGLPADPRAVVGDAPTD
jgi:hypothetical protein